MKRLLALLIGCTCCEAKSIVTDDLVDKFAVIESNYNFNAVGDNGKALGAWQMHKSAFQESLNSIHRRTGSDWSEVWTWDKKTLSYPNISRFIAKEYMLILEKQMLKMGYKPTPISLYMAWNMGFSGAKSHDFKYDSYDLDSKRVSILRRANQILSR